MSNHIKGKVTDIFKSNEKEHAEYGKSANLKITIDNGAEYNLFYNYGKPGNLKGEPVAIGDEVEFEWERNDKFGSKDILNKKDNPTFKNLTNPSAIPEKKSFGGGFKSDPDREVRTIFGTMIGDAIRQLTHNSPELKVLKKDVLELATDYTQAIYAFKLNKNDSAPLDEDVPF